MNQYSVTIWDSYTQETSKLVVGAATSPDFPNGLAAELHRAVCAATSEDIDHPLSGWTIWQTIQMREHMVVVLTQNGQLSTYCVTPYVGIIL